MDLREAELRTIIRGNIGSVGLGINLPGNVPDHDEYGIVVEPLADAMGIGANFEQLIHRTAADREGKKDAPSMPGDLDLQLYSLRKYLRLVVWGNPTLLSLLFIQQKDLIAQTPTGKELQALAPKLVSKRAGKAFLGYMQSQKQRLMGERAVKVNRHDLVAKHGFDTKFAMHMLRLGIQGVELLTTGGISMPLYASDREFLLNVRQGKYTLEDCLERATNLEGILLQLSKSTHLPDVPDEAAIQKWMLDVYMREWVAEGVE